MAGFDFTAASGSESLQLGERGGVYLETPNGIMQWWNDGMMGFKNGIYL